MYTKAKKAPPESNTVARGRGSQHRRIALSATLAFFCFFIAQGQHNFTLYHLHHVPQVQTLNPGVIPLVKGFAGFPGLSGLRGGVASNAFSYNHLNVSDEFSLGHIDFGSFLERSASQNRTFLEASAQLFTLGIRSEHGFFHFEVAENAAFNFYYPNTLIDMFHDVQQVSFEPKEYDLSRVNYNGTHYRTLSLGYAHAFMPEFSIGARAKLIQGMSNIWSSNEGLRFINTGDSENFLLQGRMEVLSAGFNNFEQFNFTNYFSQGSGNSGFGFDVGMNYRLNDRVELSASAINIGMIKWRNDVNFRVISNSTRMFSSVDIDLLGDQIDDVFEELVEEGPPSQGVRYQTPLNSHFFLSGQYYYRHNIWFGAMLSPRLSNGYIDWGYALSANARLGRNVGVALSYSGYNMNYVNVGAGLTLDWGPVQLYAISDNVPSMFGFRDARDAQFHAGLNFIFGRIYREELVPGLAPPPKEKDIAETQKVQGPMRKGKAPPRAEGPKEEAAPTPAAEEPAALSRYFTLKGRILDQDNGQQLQGLVMEIYRVGGDEQRRLVYTGAVYSGEFSAPLSREFYYQIVLRKVGYDNIEVNLDGQKITSGNIERSFYMRVSPPPLPPVSSLPAYTDTEAPEESPRNTPEGSAPEQAAPQAPRRPRSLGVFSLTDETSLREGPHHTHKIITRFRPGDRVELLEKTERLWWKVRFKGLIGYAKALLMTNE
jgi:hypothetical protein